MTINTDPALLGRRACSVAQLAVMWDVPKAQVYAAIHEGRLRAFKIGKHFRVTDEARRAFEDSAADAA